MSVIARNKTFPDNCRIETDQSLLITHLCYKAIPVLLFIFLECTIITQSEKGYLLMIKFKTTSPEQTEKFGYELATSLCAGDVIALTGDLGAGKTCLTRGIAKGLGSTSHVSSPTFTIVNEYEGGRLLLFHFDTYRLSGPDDFLMSGLDEYFFRDGVCVIEWSDIIEELLPQDTIKMTIRGDGNTRVFECEAGEKYNGYIEKAVAISGAEKEE